MITDYASLQLEVIDAAHRDDLATIVPNFVQRAEREIARLMPLRAFEVVVTGTSAGTITLPTDFDRVVQLKLHANGREHPMDYTSPNGISGYTSGNPYRYKITNGVIEFVAPTGGQYTLIYLRKLIPLSTTITTNFVLTEHPDLYLYGTLMQLYMHTLDDAEIAQYTQRFDRAIAQIVGQDSSKRFPIAGGMQIKPRSYR